MLNLRTLWSKKRSDVPPEEASPMPLASIPRPFAPASRADFRQAFPPEPPSVPMDTRSAERFVPRRTGTVLITDSGKKINARIINVSATGIAVEADLTQVPPQSVVMIGERRVRMGRKISRGTVFLFEVPLPKHICGPDFIA